MTFTGKFEAKMLSKIKMFIIYFRDIYSVDGASLEASLKEQGYNIYNLKIFKQINLEDSNDFRCKNYDSVDDFGRVSTNKLLIFWI